MLTDDALPPIGIILYERNDGSEAVLARFARSLRDSGVDVGGLVQRTEGDPERGNRQMTLIDVRTGAEFCISQNLGGGSVSHNLDLAGLMEASQVLRREIDHGVGLLVVNKFSRTEFEGKGFAPEAFEAISRGIPLLTSVPRAHLAQWDEMTGGAGDRLTPDLGVLGRWWQSGQHIHSATCG